MRAPQGRFRGCGVWGPKPVGIMEGSIPFIDFYDAPTSIRVQEARMFGFPVLDHGTFLLVLGGAGGGGAQCLGEVPQGNK